VLPFVNMSSDKENEYFSDGMTEELINALAKVEGLRVPARTSAFAFKGKQADIRRIGKELGVATVLEGSVRKAGNRLKITAQLVNVADGYHLWSETYERELEDVFAVQEEISRAIVDALEIKLGGAGDTPLVKRPTAETEAYNLYLKGRYFWNTRTEEGLRKGIEYFRQAIERDTNYALAYAGLADSYVSMAGRSYLPPKEAYPKAKAAARKALEIDDTLAEAHTSLAMISSTYDWDWGAAERGFKRAIELDPSYAPAHQGYGGYLAAWGRPKEGIAELRRALELDRLSLNINTGLGVHLYHAGQYDQAIQQARRALELDPNFASGHVLLGRAYLEKSMNREAVAEFEKAVEVSEGHPEMLAALARGYARSGKREEAMKILEDLEERSKREYVPPYWIAHGYAGLDDKDQTFKWLVKAYEDRSSWMRWLREPKSLTASARIRASRSC
jgi:TolB-like protein/Tfp pilus assembly protein PilF